MFRFGKAVFVKRGILPKFSFYFSKSQKRSLVTSTVALQKYKTLIDIRKELSKSLQAYVAHDAKPKLAKKISAQSQDNLPVKRMKDSFDSAIVPLSTNHGLRDKYTTFLGHVRLGRLMEDLDIFAVWCCMKHLSNPAAPETESIPYIIVTIRVDHIEVLNSLRQTTSDIRLSGHVCWVGKSSLEVIVWLDQDVNGKWERIMKALMLMAARDPTNSKGAVVNALAVETPEEKELFEGGERRKKLRLQMMKESLLKGTPTNEEFNVVHNLFRNTIDSGDIFLDKRILPPDSKWMQDATLSNLVFCHPEYRNIHNKIFGGFLIRKALELSWSIAYLYGKRVPKMTHMSDILFINPVDVGSLLKLYASVTYSEGSFIQVFVYAEAFTYPTGEGKSTNSFYFTYDTGEKCDSLYPLTYLEAMKYIEGRRSFLNSKEFKKEKIEGISHQ